MRIYRNDIYKFISVILLISLLCGCAGAAGDQTSADTVTDDAVTSDYGTASGADEEEDVELIEPAGSALSFVNAEIRDLAVVSTSQGVVCPNTYEYSYESEQPFGNYCYLPGDEVSAGDMLFYGTADGLDEKIEDIYDENTSLLESYNDYVSDYHIDIAKARKKEFEAASAYQDLLAYAPEQDSPYYTGWAKGAMPLENAYKQAKKNLKIMVGNLSKEINKHIVDRIMNDPAYRGRFKSKENN